MIFGIDEDVILSGITEAMEDAGVEMSVEMSEKIIQIIDKSMPGIMGYLGQGIQEYWKNRARQASGWGNKYSRAIDYRNQGDNVEIFVDPKTKDKGSNKPNLMFAKMMEGGVRTWSIKDALLASKKAKTGKDGVKYITVPFPVAVPRKKNQGTMQQQFGKREMTNEIYNLVKGGGKVPTGTSISAGGKDVDITGLAKYQTRQLHGQYGIFRRVSEKTQGWQYPNMSPRPVFPSVLKEVNRQIHSVIKNFCAAIVK